MDAPLLTITPPEGFKYEEGKPFTLPATAIDLKQIAPKEIAEKDYFKKITNTEELFKAFDGAQTLLGKKPTWAAPAADAADEEWKKFFETIRPAKPDEYKFEDDPNLPKELKGSPEYQTEMKALLHSAGITARQAKILQKGYDGLTMKMHEKDKKTREAMDTQFQEVMKKHFGDKADEKIARAKKIFEYIIPKEMAVGVNALPNEQLGMMAVFANLVADKYIKEDELPTGGGGTAGKTVADLKKMGMEKMVEMGKLDAMDPRKKAMQKEIDEIYAQISKM